MPINDKNLLKETTAALEEIRQFNASTLARTEDLGKDLNFEGVVDEAKGIISTYKLISLEVLKLLPDAHLQKIKAHIDKTNNLIEEVNSFNALQNDAGNSRNRIIDSIREHYSSAISNMSRFVMYSMIYNREDSDVQGKIDEVLSAGKSEIDSIVQEMQKTRQSVDEILNDVREVAKEQGVSQQASYFKGEADKHEKSAQRWQWTTILFAILLVVLAGGSMFYDFGIEAENTYQIFHVITSKFLFFGVLSYMLYLSAKNFLSHKHNEVLNRHRQNALMTVTELSQAATVLENRDIVLNHASASIFTPQDTGYVKVSANNISGGAMRLVDNAHKVIKAGTEKSD